jgi:hypothetical protein
VLGTRPGHLLEVDPEEASSDILEIWADIPEEQREQARDVLKTFRRKREAASASLEPAGQAGARGGGKGPERI